MLHKSSPSILRCFAETQSISDNDIVVAHLDMAWGKMMSVGLDSSRPSLNFDDMASALHDKRISRSVSFGILIDLVFFCPGCKLCFSFEPCRAA